MASQQEIYNQLQSVLGGTEPPPYENESSQVEDLSFLEFLFTVVQQASGQNKFKDIVFNNVLGDVQNNISVDNIVKDTFRNKTFCNLNLGIPSDLTISGNNGIFVEKSAIDAFNLLKVDPASQTGSLLYNSTDPEKDLNTFIFNSFNARALREWKNENNQTIFGLTKQGNGLLFQFGDEYKNGSFKEWSEDFFASIEIFNPVNFFSQIVDVLTGALSVQGNKNRIEIENDSTVIEGCKKLFGFCSSESNNNSNENEINTSPQEAIRRQKESKQFNDNDGGNTADESEDFPFNFSNEEKNEIEREARLKRENKLQFKSCGNLELPLDSQKVVNELQGIFQNFDPDSAQSNNNSKINPEDASSFIENTAKDGAKNLIDQGESSVTADFNNINAENEIGVLKSMPYALMKIILSPKILIFGKIFEKFVDSENAPDAIDLIKKLKNVIGEIGAAFSKAILNNVFNFIKNQLESLVSELKGRFLEQQLLDYASVLEFLTSLISSLTSDNDNCSSILSTILKILSLSSFVPAPPFPPPLVFGAVPLKPGMNETTAINDMKSKMEEKGLNTGYFYDDGTPNYQLFAMESAVSAVIKNIKNYSKIDVTTLGPTGPTQGSGQIQ